MTAKIPSDYRKRFMHLLSEKLLGESELKQAELTSLENENRADIYIVNKGSMGPKARYSCTFEEDDAGDVQLTFAFRLYGRRDNSPRYPIIFETERRSSIEESDPFLVFAHATASHLVHRYVEVMDKGERLKFFIDLAVAEFKKMYPKAFAAKKAGLQVVPEEQSQERGKFAPIHTLENQVHFEGNYKVMRTAETELEEHGPTDRLSCVCLNLLAVLRFPNDVTEADAFVKQVEGWFIRTF